MSWEQLSSIGISVYAVINTVKPFPLNERTVTEKVTLFE